jgi:UDP-glucose:(heptosyl)LPS alpha-1,3-glucosyltransferase
MKIALSFPGCHRRGGVERVMVECANFLAARGHSVCVIAADFDPNVLSLSIEKIHVSAASRIALLRLTRFAKSSPSALAGLNPPADVHAAFGVICPPGGVFWVPSVHAAWIEISQRERSLAGRAKQWTNPIHPYLLARERWYFKGRRYKRLIALTEQVKADLIRFYNVPAGDIDILPNGYNPAEFNVQRRVADRAAVRRELGYADADRVIVFVANELERKGFGPLMRAVARSNDKSLRMLVVGRVAPGGYSAEMQRLGIAERVKFIGPSSDVGRYYAASDVFALPTTYEAWGLVIVEAMACGLPVLTSRLAGAAITVQEGKTGELLDNPRDVDEIAVKLQKVLALGAADTEVIAVSVGAYRWEKVLERYEIALAAHSKACGKLEDAP